MNSSAVSADRLNRVKKWLPCLGCGRPMWTDRCHRICRKCRRRRAAAPQRPAFHVSMPPDLVLAHDLVRTLSVDH